MAIREAGIEKETPERGGDAEKGKREKEGRQKEGGRKTDRHIDTWTDEKTEWKEKTRKTEGRSGAAGGGGSDIEIANCTHFLFFQ